ncbi:MAG: hypothetical protein ACLFV8_06870 [Alphaproteobacteria bacterium]
MNITMSIGAALAAQWGASSFKAIIAGEDSRQLPLRNLRPCRNHRGKRHIAPPEPALNVLLRPGSGRRR